MWQWECPYVTEKKEGCVRNKNGRLVDEDTAAPRRNAVPLAWVWVWEREGSGRKDDNAL